MSEAAATDAAVAAPAPAEATPAPAAPAPAPASSGPESSGSGQIQPQREPQGPQDRNSLRAAAATRAKEAWAQREAAPEAATTAQEAPQEGAVGEAPGEQPRDAQGRFVAATDGSAAPDGAAHADGDAVSRTDAVPDGFVRIELPEGHPYRRGDKTHWLVPQEGEQDARTFLNQFTRRAELEEAERRAAMAEARAELAMSGAFDPKSDPELKAKLEDIQKTYPELYEEFVENHQRKLEERVREMAEEKIFAQQQPLIAREFMSEIMQPGVRDRFAGWTDAEFQAAFSPERLTAYGYAVDARRKAGDKSARPNLIDYVQWRPRDDSGKTYMSVADAYTRDPKVAERARQREAERQRQIAEQARQEALREFQAQQEAQRRADMDARHRTVRGPGQLNRGAVRTPDLSVDPSPPAPETPVSPTQRRDLGRMNARERGIEMARRRGY